MTLVVEYNDARRAERIARVRRVVVLRAMNSLGLSQREIAASLGISQPAVSQQVAASARFGDLSASDLLEAAAPVLKLVAEKFRYTELAVFGSVARGDSRADSDIDLLVRPPSGTSSFDFVEFKQVLEEILGRAIDLVSYGGLDPALDKDILIDRKSL